MYERRRDCNFQKDTKANGASKRLMFVVDRQGRARQISDERCFADHPLVSL